MKTPYKLTSEKQLNECYELHILPFWHQQVVQSSFTSDDGIRINYAYCLHPNAKAAIVISPGRTESYLKYQELIFDLYHNDYSVFCIDHRGQGLSGRLIADPQKGYIDNFQHYIDDFHYFCQHIVAKYHRDRKMLVGHSMGAAIATLYLQQHPSMFSAAAMSAPMYGFRPGPLPLFVSKWLVRSFIAIKAFLRRSSDYFYGQMDYQPTLFEDNLLTHSRDRYGRFRDLYNSTEKLHLGGITYHWLATTLRALEIMFANIDKIKTPLMLIQCCDDAIVNQAEQNRFYRRLSTADEGPKVQKIELHGARHEVFFETDLMRTRALHSLLSFFDEQVLNLPQSTPDLHE